jgi:hypothetical protein
MECSACNLLLTGFITSKGSISAKYFSNIKQLSVKITSKKLYKVAGTIPDDGKILLNEEFFGIVVSFINTVINLPFQ